MLYNFFVMAIYAFLISHYDDSISYFFVTIFRAAKEGFNVTLMERLLKKSSREDEETCNHQATLSFMLRVQYRMNVHIMQWPSQFLYENQLLAHHSVDGHVLSDLEVVASSETTDCPIVFIDTAGCDLYELQTEEEESKGNEGNSL